MDGVSQTSNWKRKFGRIIKFSTGGRGTEEVAYVFITPTETPSIKHCAYADFEVLALFNIPDQLILYDPIGNVAVMSCAHGDAIVTYDVDVVVKLFVDWL